MQCLQVWIWPTTRPWEQSGPKKCEPIVKLVYLESEWRYKNLKECTISLYGTLKFLPQIRQKSLENWRKSVETSKKKDAQQIKVLSQQTQALLQRLELTCQKKPLTLNNSFNHFQLWKWWVIFWLHLPFRGRILHNID